MYKDTIKEYILSKSEFQVPEVQKRYSLSYPEIKQILDELLEKQKIVFSAGMTYKVIKKTSSVRLVHKPKNKQEEINIKALWEFIKCQKASTAVIQRKFSVGYSIAARAIDWMEENKYISPFPEREVMLSRDEFIQKYGNLDENDLTENEEPRRGIRSVRHINQDNTDDDDEDDDGFSPITFPSNPFINDDDTDDDDEEDDLDEDDDDDNYSGYNYLYFPNIKRKKQSDKHLGKSGDVKFAGKTRKENDDDEGSDSFDPIVYINKKHLEAKAIMAERELFDEVDSNPEGEWLFATDAEFEEKCMDIIEKIVRLNREMERSGAIRIAKNWMEQANKPDRKKVYERVYKEFNKATDYEYELLKTQLFS